MSIFLIQMVSVNFENTLWLSDAFRNLNNTTIQTEFANGEMLLHFRDYRFDDTTSLYGEAYRFNLFRGLIRLSWGKWNLWAGDNDAIFGRGLSLFLSTDDKALLESYLRGAKLDYGDMALYAGFKRKFVYYTGDKYPQYLMGFYVEKELIGFNGTMYSDTAEHRGFLGSTHIEKDFESISFYAEGAYRYGEDIFTLSQNYGYGLFLSISYFAKEISFNIEAKDYYRLYQGFNLPAPANEYGILSSNGRYERGLTLSLEGRRFRASLTHEMDRQFDRLLEYYSLTAYSVGILSWKVSAHRLWWRGNMDDYVAFSEIKYSPSWGVILYGEYRNRKGEHQPMLSLTFINGGANLTLLSRYYSFSKRWDYSITMRYDNLNDFYLEVSYGRFSGDIVCSSGICRYEPPFEGLRISASYVWNR